MNVNLLSDEEINFREIKERLALPLPGCLFALYFFLCQLAYTILKITMFFYYGLFR